MSLFGKIKTLIGNENNSQTATEDIEEFSPAALDDPPQYTFVEAMLAARQGNLQKIEDYLKFNKNYVHCKNWDDSTLLHEATRFARKDTVALLLAQGANPNALFKGQTPLHLTIEGDSREITHKTPEEFLDYRKRRRACLKQLVEQGADVNLTNENDETPLHLAAKLGYWELVEELLAQGSDVDVAMTAQDNNAPYIGRTPLLLAIRHSKDKKTIHLLLNTQANPNRMDNTGYMPLHYIAAHRASGQDVKESHLQELALLLLKYKANINAPTGNREQTTPLHLAVQHQHPGLVELFVKHGADIKIEDGQGLMPIARAAKQGEGELVKYFYEKGIDLHESKALFHAAGCKHTDAPLRYLLDTGVDINMPDQQGYTPLFSAISAHSLTNVKLLLDRGVDTKMHSPKGLTVLEHAFACWGEVECLDDDQTVSADRREASDNARDIIELLGGFEHKKPKLYI